MDGLWSAINYAEKSTLPMNLKFNKSDQNQIIASRFMFQTIDMKTAIDEVSMLESLRELAKKHSDLNITFYNLFFPFFDQYALVKPSLLKNYLIASGMN